MSLLYDETDKKIDGLMSEFHESKGALICILQEFRVNKEICTELTDLHDEIGEKMRLFAKTESGDSEFLLELELKLLLTKQEALLREIQALASFDTDAKEFDKTLKGLNILCNSQWTKANVFMKEK